MRKNQRPDSEPKVNLKSEPDLKKNNLGIHNTGDWGPLNYSAFIHTCDSVVSKQPVTNW
jgi:hypothetical protein